MKNKLKLILLTFSLLYFPKVNFGQVTLGPDASKFVLFTSSGAIGDNASAHSHITGDVGSVTAGTITGFGNVNGVMHPGSDAAITACGIDLANTLAQINSNPATLFPSATMGSGVIFTPGVYSIPGNATLTLDLILDAMGNPNAEFIIKIQGTFGANTNSKIKLINGALACHVFWKIDGAVSMASLSTMRGNIISGGAIDMGSGDSLEGRAFVTPAGSITIDGITAFTPIGCGSPVLTGPSAPGLGSLECYEIFSSIGALDGNLSSTSIGDVGNAGGGSVTGWTAGNVTGTLHLTGDASTMLAATDLSNLYNTLNAMPNDIELLYPAEFGNNLVLTPHVYLLNGATTFTDSLYLDAQNNPNGVFVIKITGGALASTSVHSNVKLINGAQSKNIFWMVDGAMSINNYSNFRGTMVVSAGAINLVNTGVLLDGRALTMNGAITTAGLAGATPSGSAGTAGTITGPASVCVGQTGVIYSVPVIPGASGYIWTISAGATITAGANTNSITVDFGSSSVSGNLAVQGSGSCHNGIVSSNFSVTVNPLPTITITASSNTVCTGSSVTLTGSGATSYTWTGGVTNGISFIPTSTNTYTVTGTNGNNCTGTATVSVNVNSLPTIIVTASSNTVCAGTSVTLTGSGATSYTWTGGVTNGISFIPASTKTYTVTGTNGNNCTGTATVTVNVNPLPTITVIASSNTVCAGSSVTLTGIGATSYTWTGGVTNGISFIPASTNTYTVTGTNGNNCTGTATVTVNVNSLPGAIGNSNSSICAGSSINLSAQTVSGATYLWTGPNGYSSPIQNPVIVSASLVNAGTYSLSVSNNGCNSTASTVTVVVNNCTVASSDLSVVKTVNNTQPIIGQTIVFTITATNNGPDAATGVTVTDILQSGYSYVSSTTTAGTYNSSTGIWTIGTLANGASAILTITVKVVAAGNYVNTATIKGSDIDPISNNDVSVIETFPIDFFIPEGFSPNGDAINDLFVIRGISNYPANTFEIFNRWGDKIFHASPYQNTWDGKATSGLRVGGDELPVGTYFYVLDLGDGSAIFKGTIYLNR